MVKGKWEVSPFSLWGPLTVRAPAAGLPEDRAACGPRPPLVALECSDPLLLNRSFSRLRVGSDFSCGFSALWASGGSLGTFCGSESSLQWWGRSPPKQRRKNRERREQMVLE